MKTRAVALITLIVCLLFATAPVFAHGGEEHVIGTVTQIAADSITVKTTANKIVTVAVVAESKFTKAKAAAKLTDLHVGDRVVIHAKEPSEGHLVADTVEFAAAKPAQTSATPQQSQTQTLTGVVSDSACGATHSMKNMSAADCTRMCVKAGQKYALVVGAEVYTLKGHEADLQKLAGEKVTVKGAVAGKNITVESVTPAAGA